MGEPMLLHHHSPYLSLSNIPRLSHLSPNRSCFLTIKSPITSFSQSIHMNRFSARVLLNSKVPSVVFESTGGGDNEVHPGIGGGYSDGYSRGRGGGSGGGGGGSEESSEGKKMAISMLQMLTLFYAKLIIVGRLMRYTMTSNTKMLVNGGYDVAILSIVYTALPINPIFASAIGLGCSTGRLQTMSYMFKKLGMVFPYGAVSLASLIIDVSYLTF